MARIIVNERKSSQWYEVCELSHSTSESHTALGNSDRVNEDENSDESIESDEMYSRNRSMTEAPKSSVHTKMSFKDNSMLQNSVKTFKSNTMSFSEPLSINLGPQGTHVFSI